VAIFTNKADAGLPLLTQFYQLEFDSAALAGSELDRWVGDETYPSLERYWSETASAKASKGPIDGLRMLALVHPTIKSVMEHLADGTAAPPDVASLLNQYLATLPPLQVYWVEAGLSLIIGGSHPGVEWPEKIFRALMGELVEAIEPILNTVLQPRPFLRCEECQNPYLVTKTGQRFCSQRCRARTGERRRYAVRMEGYPTKNKRPYSSRPGARKKPEDGLPDQRRKPEAN